MNTFLHSTGESGCVESPLIETLLENSHEWLTYLGREDAADICHHPAWGNILAETFGLKTYLVVHRTKGTIQGGLPLCLCDQPFTGRAMISMPFLNYGGLLASDQKVKKTILNKCRQLINKKGIDYMELRHNGSGIGELADRTIRNRISFSLNLNRSPEAIFESFKKQLRTRIRKAAKQDLTLYQGKDRLTHFYDTFVQAMKEHGTPVLPKRFFAAVLKYLPDNAEIMIAYKDNRPIGGKMYLKFKDKLTMTWGCFPNRYKHLLANYLLTWSLIEQFANGPVQTLDFGRSPKNSGGYAYKSNWGPDEIPISTDYIAANPNKIPNLRPENIKFKIPILIWKKMPLPLTKLIGPRLAKYFT
jgi:FemAB-related protein (PEP-CTERM system-associated)